MAGVNYRRIRKERKKQQREQRWVEQRRHNARAAGEIGSLGVAFESFARMGFFARVWWLLTGRFDRVAVLRQARAEAPTQAPAEAAA